jgi:hypothetical protein
VFDRIIERQAIREVFTTIGGERTFAAISAKVCYADIAAIAVPGVC